MLSDFERLFISAVSEDWRDDQTGVVCAYVSSIVTNRNILHVSTRARHGLPVKGLYESRSPKSSEENGIHGMMSR